MSEVQNLLLQQKLRHKVVIYKCRAHNCCEGGRKCDDLFSPLTGWPPPWPQCHGQAVVLNLSKGHTAVRYRSVAERDAQLVPQLLHKSYLGMHRPCTACAYSSS